MKIGFIGAGNMALALARGLVKSSVVPAAQLRAYARTEPSRQRFVGAFPAPGPVWAKDNLEVCRESDLIVLAIKPQRFAEVIPTLKPESAGKLFLSIAAGKTIAAIESWLDPQARVVRAMPNTPALVGAGASAYAGGHQVRAADYALVHQVLASVGHAVQVEELQLDAVTALSGSGPAYFFEIMEALIEAGVEQGLPVGLARTLVVQTCGGAARLAEQTGETPAALAAKVKSPGGTTEAGCRVLEESGLREILMEAVAAAKARATELAQPE